MGLRGRPPGCPGRERRESVSEAPDLRRTFTGRAPLSRIARGTSRSVCPGADPRRRVVSDDGSGMPSSPTQDYPALPGGVVLFG